MPSGWVGFFSALHVAAFVAIVLLFSSHEFVDPALYAVAAENGSKDALSVAYDLGRLELLALSLTVLAVSIGIFAVLGYWIYGHLVDRAARKETREIAPHEIAKIMKDDPGLWLRVIRANPLTFRSAIVEALSETDDLGTVFSSTGGDEMSNADWNGDGNEQGTGAS